MYVRCELANKRWLLARQLVALQGVAHLLLLFLALILISGELLTIRPTTLGVEAVAECSSDSDCPNRDKICHENRCICARDRPIEDQERCLSLSLIGESCALSLQCLGNSLCEAGVCSCGNESISLYNPSSKIYYCHPKRRLNEECNYDSQCPSNSYCSTSKFGCLCLNGYAPATVSGGSSNNNAIESLECLAKFCSDSSSCESEFHQCDENKCKCIATHFNPETAKCYKFGSTGGKEANEDSTNQTNNENNMTNVATTGDDISFYSIMKDLRENSDRMWLVLIILITLSILLLALIFMLIRKYTLGYCCWTAHKKEYQPNTKKQPKNGYFNKNSINNKSFRQKNGETDDDDTTTINDIVDSDAADKSSLVNKNSKKNNNNNTIAGKSSSTNNTGATNNASVVMSALNKDKNSHHHNYVKVNISENHQDTSDSFNDNIQQYYQQQQHQQIISPLKSSTSTPV